MVTVVLDYGQGKDCSIVQMKRTLLVSSNAHMVDRCIEKLNDENGKVEAPLTLYDSPKINHKSQLSHQ